jgi:hypothetical protein
MWTKSCYILAVTVFYRTGPHPISAREIRKDGEKMKIQMGEKKFFRKALLAAAVFVGG